MFESPAEPFSPSRVGPPRFLHEPEPWVRVFLRNLRDLFRSRPRYISTAPPAEFWPDVFVRSRLPWLSLGESAVYHIVAVGALVAWVHFLPPSIRRPSPFQNAQVTIFPISRDLPQIDTGRTPTPPQRTGDPAFSRQPIISVPPQADNREQTIITPPDLVLRHNVPLPNIVAWTALPSAPPAALAGLSSQRIIPAPDMSVVNPAPELDAVRTARMQIAEHTAVAPSPEAPQQNSRSFKAPEAAIVEPPPSVDTSIRRAGDVNIGRSEVIAPAPELPMAAQRALNGSGSGTQMSAAAVPPPPTVEAGGGGGGPGGGRVIALSLHPAPPAATVEVPLGNRRGEFAATPGGKPQGTGAPDSAGVVATSTKPAGMGGGGNGHGGAAQTGANLPTGIYVGEAENAKAVIAGPDASTTITIERTPVHATLPPPRVDVKRKPATAVDHPVSNAEKRIFGNRRFYSMPLNMPNLNSASGSWIIRFAELKEDPGQGVLFAPEATRKVDPAYPPQFQRDNVQGTVTLYAVIRSDGSIGEIRVLDGLQNDLDRYAMEALGRCKFAPAVRNGEPVALEAVVMIPFRIKAAF